MSGGVFQDHWFPGFSASGPDVRSGVRTIFSLNLVSQGLILGEGCQDHWFPGFSVPGSDVRWGFSGPLVPWI